MPWGGAFERKLSAQFKCPAYARPPHQRLNIDRCIKKRTTKRCRRAREPSRIPLVFLRGFNKKNGMLKNFVFKKISAIEIPKSSKLHRYVDKVRKLYHARYKCNNKRDPKIINVNKIAIPKKAYWLSLSALAGIITR